MIILENELEQIGLNGLFKKKQCKVGDRRIKCGGGGTKVGNALRKAKTVIPIAASFIPVFGGSVGRITEKLLNSKTGKFVKQLKNKTTALTEAQKMAISQATGVNFDTKQVVAPLVTEPTPIINNDDADVATNASEQNKQPVINGDDVSENLTDLQAKTIAEIKEVKPIKPEETKNNMPLILGGIAVVAIGAYFLSQKRK